MTGAGAATVAFAKESSFMGSLADPDADGTPEYWLPGRNIRVEDVELSNALERLRVPDSAESIESIAGPLEGAFSATWAMSADTHDDVRDIVFNDAGSGFVDGAAATSRWFTGIDYISGTAERELLGVTPTEYSISYDQSSNTVEESITAVYADEQYNTSITPSSIIGPTEGSTVPFHGFSLDVDAATVQKLQSATLSISNIARLQRGPSRTALDAIIATPQTTLETEAIFDGPSGLELAYGAANATSPQSSVNATTATITLTAAGSTVATYNCSGVKPDTYNWSELVGEEDLTEPITHHVNGVSVS